MTVHLGGVRTRDVLYNALPLYHSSAGMLAVGPAIMFGVTVALRRKFSVSHFWKDCCRYNVTVRHISLGHFGPLVLVELSVSVLANLAACRLVEGWFVSVV